LERGSKKEDSSAKVGVKKREKEGSILPELRHVSIRRGKGEWVSKKILRF